MFNSDIKPMEPQLRSQPFDSQQHIFQVKWDGVRILAFVSKDRVRLQNRKLNDRTMQYPELSSLTGQINCREVILDGEMIALKEGIPSFSRILKRDLAAGSHTPSKQVPVIYMVFDVLYYNGIDLTAFPWEERDRRLKEILIPSENVQITDSVPDRGIDLYQAVLEQGLEGIVAKDRTSPYIIGGKTSYWQKIKPRKDMNCIVGGYILENNRLKSLLIGAYHKNKLRFLGKTGSGLSQQTSEELMAAFPNLKINECPFAPEPKKQSNWHWVKPVLTIKVEYMEFTSQMQLRQPSIKGFTKIAPEECIMAEG